ncbi:hypothetical protein [Microbulbifer taiwanensis]|nr:hypothetical protein [Microbulbifer taiwanensis]
MAGGAPTGTVIIESDPDPESEDYVGSTTSFIQFRCDSGVEEATPITIDNLVIERQ